MLRTSFLFIILLTLSFMLTPLNAKGNPRPTHVPEIDRQTPYYEPLQPSAYCLWKTRVTVLSVHFPSQT